MIFDDYTDGPPSPTFDERPQTFHGKRLEVEVRMTCQETSDEVQVSWAVVAESGMMMSVGVDYLMAIWVGLKTVNFPLRLSDLDSIPHLKKYQISHPC